MIIHRVSLVEFLVGSSAKSPCNLGLVGSLGVETLEMSQGRLMEKVGTSGPFMPHVDAKHSVEFESRTGMMAFALERNLLSSAIVPTRQSILLQRLRLGKLGIDPSVR